MADLVSVLAALSVCSPALHYVEAYGDDDVSAMFACPNRRWLTWLAGALMVRGHLDRRVIVLYACASARTALRYISAGEDRPLQVIETTEAWCRGKATIEEVREARKGAADAAAAAAAYAAAYAAYAADADAAAADAAADAAAYAADYAADAADYAADAAAADAADYAADAWRSARAKAEAYQLLLTKWMLGPALIDGFRAYAAKPSVSG